jgi:hypothetical protein
MGLSCLPPLILRTGVRDQCEFVTIITKPARVGKHNTPGNASAGNSDFWGHDIASLLRPTRAFWGWDGCTCCGRKVSGRGFMESFCWLFSWKRWSLQRVFSLGGIPSNPKPGKKRSKWRETLLMLHFLMQAINPVRPLLTRLRNWGKLSDDLQERPRKRQLQMEAPWVECRSNH